MEISMLVKIIFFTSLHFIPLLIWYKLLVKHQIKIDLRLILSYFIFGAWFGMYGELFLFKFIEFFFNAPIWEYRTLPIHDGITSSYGPIMWGNAAVYICFHKNYSIFKAPEKENKWKDFALESFFLLVVETVFNLMAFAIFNEYFFYYFVPDLAHWTSLTNLPFWWVGYHMIVKVGNLFYKQEKANLLLAIMLLIIVYSFDFK